MGRSPFRQKTISSNVNIQRRACLQHHVIKNYNYKNKGEVYPGPDSVKKDLQPKEDQRNPYVIEKHLRREFKRNYQSYSSNVKATD